MRYRKQHRRRYRMPPAWWRAMAEVAERDTARRIALPERPADPMAGSEWVRVTIATPHDSHTIVARWPEQRGVRRPRSDQFAVEVDGVLVADLEGRTATLARIAEFWPRAMTRKQRHEADSINEQEWTE